MPNNAEPTAINTSPFQFVISALLEIGESLLAIKLGNFHSMTTATSKDTNTEKAAKPIVILTT